MVLVTQFILYYVMLQLNIIRIVLTSRVRAFCTRVRASMRVCVCSWRKQTVKATWRKQVRERAVGDRGREAAAHHSLSLIKDIFSFWFLIDCLFAPVRWTDVRNRCELIYYFI